MDQWIHRYFQKYSQAMTVEVDGSNCIRNMKSHNGYLCPLLVNSEIIGGFLILSDNHLINDQEKEVIHSLIKLLVRELEV